MNFRIWLEMSSLRDILSGVPQSPKYHPEGDVWTHTRQTRRAMDQAIDLLKQAQKEPDSPFANLDLDLTEDETKMLRLAGWLHDIGKHSATAWTTKGGSKMPWQQVPEDPSTLGGKGWQSIGHEDPEHFEPSMEKLGSLWQKMYSKASKQDIDDLWFIIQSHMGALFGKKAFEWVDDDGKFMNKRPIKLTLILELMDQFGRGGGEPEVVLAKLAATAKRKKRKLERTKELEKLKAVEREAIQSPVTMIQWWQAQEKPIRALPGALKGKFPSLPDGEIRKLMKKQGIIFPKDF